MGFELIGLFEKLLPAVYFIVIVLIYAVIILGIKIDTERKDRKVAIENEEKFRSILAGSFVEQKAICAKSFTDIDNKQEKLDTAVARLDIAISELKVIIEIFRKNGWSK